MYLITINGKPKAKTSDLRDALIECRERPGSVLLDCKSGAILARWNQKTRTFKVRKSVILRTCGKRESVCV